MRRSNIQRVSRYTRYVVLTCSAIFLILAISAVSRTILRARTANLALSNHTHSATIGEQLDAVAARERATSDNIIVKRQIFGELGSKPTPQPVSAPTQKMDLSLTLIGTFVTTGAEPYAIIEDDKKKTQEVFVVGENVFDQAILHKIFADKIEVKQDSDIVTLSLDESPASGSPDYKDGVAQGGDDTFFIEEQELDKAMENLPLLLTQARAVPYFKDGRSVGLRLFAIRSGSLFEKIGLKNGDILKAINGNSLADFSQAMQLFQKLKEERNISISLERGKQDRDFKYIIQ
ncbi:MAG: hypothetical protein KDD42_04045 [Bdellovibrionales bacterium]|nr:hypothetical protein [Bdellovibrionales bacterium]